MRGRLISFLLMLAVLFGSAVVPTIAHADGGNAVHACEVLDVHQVATTSGNDQQSPDPGMLGEAGTHHHCTAGLIAAVTDVAKVAASKQGTARPAPASLLISYAQAPPTEPPST